MAAVGHFGYPKFHFRSYYQYGIFIFVEIFYKMAAGAHFVYPKFNFQSKIHEIKWPRKFIFSKNIITFFTGQILFWRFFSIKIIVQSGIIVSGTYCAWLNIGLAESLLSLEDPLNIYIGDWFHLHIWSRHYSRIYPICSSNLEGWTAKDGSPSPTLGTIIKIF